MPNSVLYGFYDLQSMFSQRITDSMVPQINTAIDRSLVEHERQSATLFSLFARSTNGQYKLRYRTPGNEVLQPLDENGRALPTQGGSSYDVAFPLQMAGTAWGANYVARAKMTVQEANNLMAQKLTADIRWNMRHVLAAFFAAAPWTWQDKEHGDLIIQPLANNDATTYSLMSGADLGATDNHLLAQAAAISDAANPFPRIYDELLEHPENAGEVISLIPTNQRAAVENLANFREVLDPDIRAGIATDALVGSLGAPVPGVVLGKVDKVWIVEWKSLPDDYLMNVTSGGEPPVGFREDEEAELRGFKRLADRVDTPFTESQYMRRRGYGIWNKVGGVAYRIGNANYDAPASLRSPLP